MLHAILFLVVSAIAWKLGLRWLTLEEEARLPWYYVKAERIQQWVFGIVYGIFGAFLVAVVIAQALGY
jgi:hypothetical protein